MIELGNLIINHHQFCWENGGHLAEFSSSEEEARVDDILATDLDYWIGLTDLASEGKLNTSRKNKKNNKMCCRCLEVAGKSY